MRIVPALALAFAVALAAHADVVIEQKAESPTIQGRMTMKIKGDRARMDISGDVSVLMNMKTGEMTTLIHEKKLAMQRDMNAMKQQTEEAQKQAGFDPAKLEKPRATGVTEKVGEWTAEIYEFSGGNFAGKLWVARDFPNGQVIKDELKRVTAASTGGFDPNKLDVPGMVVKSQLTTPYGPMISTLVKAVLEPVADSEFLVPRDYIQGFTPGTPGANPK